MSHAVPIRQTLTDRGILARVRESVPHLDAAKIAYGVKLCWPC